MVVAVFAVICLTVSSLVAIFGDFSNPIYFIETRTIYMTNLNAIAWLWGWPFVCKWVWWKYQLQQQTLCLILWVNADTWHFWTGTPLDSYFAGQHIDKYLWRNVYIFMESKWFKKYKKQPKLDANHRIDSYNDSLKEVLHLLPKISMFCALSQNNQQLFEK